MESVGKPRKVLHLMHAILNTWSCFLLVYGCYQYQGTFLANISAHNGESIKKQRTELKLAQVFLVLILKNLKGDNLRDVQMKR